MKDDKKSPERDAATSQTGSKKLIFVTNKIINQSHEGLQHFYQDNLFQNLTFSKLPQSLKTKINKIEKVYGKPYRDLRILSALTKEFGLNGGGEHE